MYPGIHILLCFCVLPHLFTHAEKVCKLNGLDKVAEFPSLLAFEKTTRSFNPDHPTYQGNVVSFTFRSIDRLIKNSFISFGSDSIIKISLNNKGIRTIDNYAFANLFCLHYLELRNNSISEIAIDGFNGLNNLRDLDLSENRLQDTCNSEMTFHSLYNLKKLNLSHNLITDLKTLCFFNQTNLEILDVSFNKLRTISWRFYKGNSLKELYLNNNYLVNIEPEKWTNLNNLQILDLSGNYLESFDPNYNFSFYNLKKLYINRNNLGTLNVFSLKQNLPKLEVIDIGRNHWNCYEFEAIKHQLMDAKVVIVGDTSCNSSNEYVYSTTEDPALYTSTTPISVENKTENSTGDQIISRREDPILSVNNNILEKVEKLETTLAYLFMLVVIFIAVDVSARSGICRYFYNVQVRSNRLTEINSDRQPLL